jgi:hypothetical protein
MALYLALLLTLRDKPMALQISKWRCHNRDLTFDQDSGRLIPRSHGGNVSDPARSIPRLIFWILWWGSES